MHAFTLHDRPVYIHAALVAPISLWLRITVIQVCVTGLLAGLCPCECVVLVVTVWGGDVWA